MNKSGDTPPNRDKSRSALLRFLGYRPRTEREAVLKLRKIGCSQEDLEYLIEESVELGLIDDEKFAMEFVDVRMRSKKHGEIRIRRDLQKKGVDKNIIESCLSQIMTEEIQVSMALRTIPLRWTRKEGELTSADRQSILAALQRRGFKYHIARAALSQFESD